MKNNSLVATLIFSFLACLVGYWFSFYQNFYNWDLVAYWGVVLGYDTPGSTTIHSQVYEQVQQLPADAVQVLLHEVPYREQCLASASFYQKQLGFYQVKPLFTGLVYLFYKSGFTMWDALRIPSVLGFVLLASVLFVWIKKYVHRLSLAFLVTALLLCGYSVQLPRLVTPDALSNGLQLLLFYLLFHYPQRRWLAWAIWLLLVLCRIDNLVFGLPLVWFQAQPTMALPGKPVLRKTAIAAVAIVLLAVAIPFCFGNKAGWFFDYSFTHSGFEYLKQIGKSLRQFGNMPLPWLLVFVLLAMPVKDHRWNRLLMIIGFAMTCRWLLFPSFQERFFVATELAICLFLINRLKPQILEKW